jgi:hypothetical protein
MYGNYEWGLYIIFEIFWLHLEILAQVQTISRENGLKMLQYFGDHLRS